MPTQGIASTCVILDTDLCSIVKSKSCRNKIHLAIRDISPSYESIELVQLQNSQKLRKLCLRDKFKTLKLLLLPSSYSTGEFFLSVAGFLAHKEYWMQSGRYL